MIDAALCPRLAVDEASHLGGRLSRRPIYSSRLEFTTAAARVLRQRAEGLRALVLDFGAYGCVFASALLEAQPLPQLSCVELHNAEAQHVAALRSLPRLREVCLSRRINGPGGRFAAAVRLAPALPQPRELLRAASQLVLWAGWHTKHTNSILPATAAAVAVQ